MRRGALGGRAAGHHAKRNSSTTSRFRKRRDYVRKIIGTAEDYRRLYGDAWRGAGPARRSRTRRHRRTSRRRSRNSQPGTRPPRSTRRTSPSRKRSTTEPMRGSRKATAFTESVIREMTRLAQLHGAVNLAQGFPDFPAPSAHQGRGGCRHPRRHQPVRRDVGRASRSATPLPKRGRAATACPWTPTRR